MLVALTGASGFIGSATVKTLKARGHEVRAMVRETSRRDHIAEVDEWFVGEIGDEQALHGLVAGVDAVIHNALDAESLHQSPLKGVMGNVVPALQLLEAARLAQVEQYIFVSSVAAHHEILQDRTLDENHPTWPSGVYGACKASIEPFLKAYHYSFGMNTSSWRPAAVYGVDLELTRSRWHQLIIDARDGKTIDTPAGGKITHVQDVGDALALAVGDEGVAGKLFNIVDRYMYWQQAAEFARELSGSSAEIVDRKGAGPRNHFDCSAAIAFFDRHGNNTALRRGLEGVKQYVAELLPLL